MFRTGLILLSAAGSLVLSACGASYYGPYPAYTGSIPYTSQAPMQTSRTVLPPSRTIGPVAPTPSGELPILTDNVVFDQTDPRWGQDELGRSGGNLAREGCVVTSAAMAMTNLGYSIDPGELNRRLRDTGNYTPRGWLIWKGISDVSGGQLKAEFYDSVSEPLIQSCLSRGDYPLVRFFLPNGRAHWAMILGRTEQGYMMRDPLRVSRKPLIFPRDSSAFKSLRCIGRA